MPQNDTNSCLLEFISGSIYTPSQYLGNYKDAEMTSA